MHIDTGADLIVEVDRLQGRVTEMESRLLTVTADRDHWQAAAQRAEREEGECAERIATLVAALAKAEVERDEWARTASRRAGERNGYHAALTAAEAERDRYHREWCETSALAERAVAEAKRLAGERDEARDEAKAARADLDAMRSEVAGIADRLRGVL